MEKVAIEELEDWMGPATVKRPLGKALDAEDVAINYYELAPGESFAFGYHAHADQEEVFYIIEGEATFETEEGVVAVGPEEVIRFAAGEWQQGANQSDERVRALAIGAPPESGETTVLRECPECGERTEQDIRRAEDREGLVTLCTECGTETGYFD